MGKTTEYTSSPLQIKQACEKRPRPSGPVYCLTTGIGRAAAYCPF